MPRSAAQIRREFIDFFVQRAGHTYVPSAPVVPHDDPTLLFTNAGMNQFKDVFLGTGIRPYTRAVDTQKCIRAGGKHNDLEDVGKDTSHHTFFEMLGNWSFGDYFKAEAIQWAWELLTEIWKLPKERLHATYFQGDPSEDLAPDDEARNLWLRYLPADRIHPGNKKDNFWEMGDSGPCGPCSEIHFDGTSDANGQPIGGPLVNAGDPRVIEFWNLVFIQYNRAPGTGKLALLPARHVDTGMGFERITRIIQGKTSNYDTDVFTPIFAAIEQHTGAHAYRGAIDDPVDVAYRVIADHIRCLTVAITDGVRPSNEGRGYVLRRILRRAVRHAHQTLNVKGSLLHKLVPAVVDSLGGAFPELKKNPRAITDVVREEEEAFLKTLDRGITLFNEAAAVSHLEAPPGKWIDLPREAKPVIPADVAFRLHDTYGFPIDLTRVMAEERGMSVDEAGFNALMERAREKSRGPSGGETEQEFALPPDALARLAHMKIKPTDDSAKFIAKPVVAKVEAIWNGEDFDEHTELSRKVAVILNRTNFYAEQGGQVGDAGSLRGKGESESARDDEESDRGRSIVFNVEDTQVIGPPGQGYVLHIGHIANGELRVGEEVQASIEQRRREPIRANHTSTHLLNLALRTTLGDHINQKGSLVADDRLRFDFSHPGAIKTEQIEAVERSVNAAIAKALRVYADDVPLEMAKKINGVRAVFGEKYPDPVRVVSIGVPILDLVSNPANPLWHGFSIEFCGGTHLTQSSEARHLVILREEALAAGVRRITALTGSAAQAADMAGRDLEHRAQNAQRLADDLLVAEFDEIVKLSEELTISSVHRHRLAGLIETLRGRVKSIRKSAQSAATSTVVDQARALVEKSNGKVIVEEVSGADKDSLLAAMDVVRAKRPDAAAMLLSANEIESKVFIVAAVPKACIDLGLKAGEWVKQAAAICGGSGGGRPDMAQAGGKDPAKVGDAIAAAKAFAAQKIK